MGFDVQPYMGIRRIRTQSMGFKRRADSVSLLRYAAAVCVWLVHYVDTGGFLALDVVSSLLPFAQQRCEGRFNITQHILS